MQENTLTLDINDVRKLIDIIPEEPAYEELINAMDSAQGTVFTRDAPIARVVIWIKHA